VIVDGVEFVEDWAMGISRPDRFAVMKPPALMDAYLELLARHEGGRMVELGIREGGSTALMALAGRPSSLVAFELAGEAPALTKLIEARNLPVTAHYGVDQADGETLARLVDGPLDLVVDEAKLAQARQSGVAEAAPLKIERSLVELVVELIRDQAHADTVAEIRTDAHWAVVTKG
jgi:hypothetical protein